MWSTTLGSQNYYNAPTDFLLYIHKIYISKSGLTYVI